MIIRTSVQQAKQENVKKEFVFHRCDNYIDYLTM